MITLCIVAIVQICSDVLPGMAWRILSTASGFYMGIREKFQKELEKTAGNDLDRGRHKSRLYQMN